MFDGADKSKWDTWYDALTDYIGVYRQDFYSDERKILYTISLLGRSDNLPSPAAVWKRNWTRRNMPDGDLSPQYNFKSFIWELERSFKDQNGIKTAHLCLTTTQQGNAGLTEFLQVFELNTEEAGYMPGEPHVDVFLMETLERLIDRKIRIQLYAGGLEVPETYEEMKLRLLIIDRNIVWMKIEAARLLASYPQGTQFWNPNKVAGPVASKKNTGGSAPNLAKPIPPGGQVPMGMDASKTKAGAFKFYNCGQEGHMKRECPAPPKKKSNI
jgi:hypothetical protein